MANNEYHFITHWRIRADVQAVIAILSDAADLPRWWPTVYLETRVLDPGDANGVGKHVALHTKGWLPYTLRWQFVVTQVGHNTYTITADGDFVGRGIWTFAQDGADALITYDWKIAAKKPLLRNLSFLFKPIFAKNHHWAMEQGRISLERELQRRASL